MLFRLGFRLAGGSSVLLRTSRPIRPSRHLFELPRRGQVRPWYRRFWPLTITLTAASASIPLGYIIYRDVLPNQHWLHKDDLAEESFDQNSESVSQSELDTLLQQTQELLNSELYSTRSSSIIVPLRLFFRTLQLLVVFTPVIIFYFIQDKFAPHLYERWCFTLKR